MVDEHFFSNIGFVTDSIDATRTIVGSIEDDIRDVRTMIQQRLQRRVDLEELVSLLQTENDILKTKMSLLEIENNNLQNSNKEDISSIQEEYEERILVTQAEMDRVLEENRKLRSDKDDILSKAQELDSYCTGVENELAKLKVEHEKVLTHMETIESERLQLEQVANQLVKDRQHQNEEFQILQGHYQDAINKIQQLEAANSRMTFQQDENNQRIQSRMPQRIDRILDERIVADSPMVPIHSHSLDERHLSDQANPYNDTAAVYDPRHTHRLPAFHNTMLDTNDNSPAPLTQESYRSFTDSPATAFEQSHRGQPLHVSDVDNPFLRETHRSQSAQGTDGQLAVSTSSASMYDLRDPDEYYDADGVQLDDLLRFKI